MTQVIKNKIELNNKVNKKVYNVSKGITKGEGSEFFSKNMRSILYNWILELIDKCSIKNVKYFLYTL